ncbi:hypothetical protein JCM5353_007275 [Sporobolomyces roseus]
MPSPHDADQETTPLIRTDSAGSTPQERPSYLSYLHDNSFLGFGAVFAQVGLLLSHVVLWKVIKENPSGLFTYHPVFQSVAVLLFIEGIILLQPPPSNATVKRTGRQLHQTFQGIATLLIITGAIFIIYNKASHGAPHFTTWHAKIGLITLSFIILQATFGAVAVFAPSLLGGEGRAKSLYKYHRLSGYFALALLVATPILALWSDWFVGHSSQHERNLVAVGYAMAAIGAITRIETSKLGFQRRRSS